MIFDYVQKEVVHYLRLQGEILPRPEWAMQLWMLAALISLYWWWRRSKDCSLLVAAALLAGTYVYSWRWTDEVFINLEHPYNLLHHGRFSFAAERWVDGTVELVYYLLLTPAAVTREWLIRGNYLLGLVLALGHLALFACWLRGFDAMVRALLLAAFALFVPFVEVCASGFGNALVSFGFLFAITDLAEGRERRGLTIAGLLPLLRPDAALFGAVALCYALLLGKPIWRGVVVTAASLAAYFSIYRVAYGHFVPTPILFKSFHWSMLPLLKLRPVCAESQVGWCFDGPPSGSFLPPTLAKALLSPSALGAYALLIVSWFHDPGEPRAVRRARLLVVPLGLISALYIITALGYNPTLFRYYAPFLLAIAILPLRYLASLMGPRAARFRRFVPAGLAVASLLAAIGLPRYPERHQGRALGGTASIAESDRLSDFLFAGRFVDRLAPAGWRIGVTEMAAFSFMNDRPIVDLWGYTNRKIATSKVCSYRGVRNDPSVLYEAQPELIWLRTGVPGALYGYPANLADEEALASWGPLGKAFNTLGDPRELVQRYDLYKLRHPEGRTTVLFVRSDLAAEFQRRLADQGLERVGDRPMDRFRLSHAYGSPALTLDCS